MRTQSTLTLAGRCVAWLEVGDPDGLPVLYCHGTPGSRLDAADYDQWATWAGLRLVAPDRPGWGRSPYRPWASHSDWAADAEAVMERAGAGDAFAVIAVSGGGPFGFAVAASMPDRVLRLALASAVGPAPTRADRRAFGWKGRAGLSRTGFSVRSAINAVLVPLLHKDLGTELPAELPAEVTRAEIRAEWLAQKSAAYLDENRHALDWTFPLTDVICPVRAWQGDRDPLAPAELLENLRGRVADLALCRVPGGHFAPYERLEEIFKWLKDGADPEVGAKP